jgi:hypothetical protein
MDADIVVGTLTLAAGTVGVLAAAIITWLRASRKSTLTIKGPRGQITVTGQTFTPADIEKIANLLSTPEGWSALRRPADTDNGKQ